MTATCLASLGHSVICVDVDRRRILDLSRGEPGFHEPRLKELMDTCLQVGSLRFASSHEYAIQNSLVHIIAVGTPPNLDGSADVSQVLSVAHTIGKHLEKYGVVVVKSTVPVGTNERVESAVADGLRDREGLVHFSVASNPEFLREGRAVQDFLDPDRVVVGSRDKNAFEVISEMYRPLADRGVTILKVSTRSAELAKYACNSMLATRVSFMNEFAALADQVGADILDVQKVMGTDRRIGNHFLSSGVGFGGSCFPKDLKAAIHLAKSVGSSSQILEAVSQTNDKQHFKLVERANDVLGGLSGRRVAIWGLAFKPETDDIREAPAIAIIRRLLSVGAIVRAHDPVVRWLPMLSSADKEIFQILENELDAVRDADALMLVTEWDRYRGVDLDQVACLMRTPLVLDGRNVWSASQHSDRPYTYIGIGRGDSVSGLPQQQKLVS